MSSLFLLVIGTAGTKTLLLLVVIGWDFGDFVVGMEEEEEEEGWRWWRRMCALCQQDDAWRERVPGTAWRMKRICPRGVLKGRLTDSSSTLVAEMLSFLAVLS
jgi:hypothetical protein